MRKNDLVVWTRFEMMIRAGVPHATDISAELVRHDLLSPLSALDSGQQVDLQFYSVVHRAYKLGVLSTFMSLLASLKKSTLWSSIQNDQDTQLRIVQQCLDYRDLELSEVEQRIHHCLLAAETLKKRAA